MIERRQGTCYIAPLREGGSLPAIIETDDQTEYVVKFRGAGQGAKSLIAETLASGLGQVLNLPIPRAAIVNLDSGFGRGEPDPEIQDLLRGSVGDNFGLRFLSGAFGFDAAVDLPQIDPDLAANIVWFDTLITNPDRTARNPNMLHWRNELWLIDHGASLYFHHRWAGWETRSRSPFPLVKDHVLLAKARDLAAADRRLHHLLSKDVLEEIVDNIPDSWLGDETIFPDTSSHRRAYLDYLCSRLEEPRLWVVQAIEAQLAS